MQSSDSNTFVSSNNYKPFAYSRFDFIMSYFPYTGQTGTRSTTEQRTEQIIIKYNIKYARQGLSICHSR
jgi:hypothetical protein